MDDSPAEPEKSDRFVDPSKIDPQTEQHRATLGTKLFVVFFFLLIPPLGVAIVAAVCWKLYRLMMAG